MTIRISSRLKQAVKATPPCQRILSDEGGLIAPVWADFLDAKASKVGTPEEISGDWDLDGNRCGERWWFNA